MRDEIVEAYGVPEIFTDGIAQVHFINDAMRWIYWSWQMSPSGVLQRVSVAKFVMPRIGVVSCRPQVTEALENHRKNPSVNQSSGAATAH